jgi:hypothetical protein
VRRPPAPRWSNVGDALAVEAANPIERGTLEQLKK